jgi:hypothetical protein
MQPISAVPSICSWPAFQAAHSLGDVPASGGPTFHELLSASINRAQGGTPSMADATHAELALRAAAELPHALVNALNEIKDLHI